MSHVRVFGVVGFTVQNGKNWIFVHNTSQRHGDLIAHYLLDRYCYLLVALLSLLYCMHT